MPTDDGARAKRLDALLNTYPGGGRALAREAGVTEPQVSRWRNGHDRLTWERTSQVAPILGVTPGELYTGDPTWLPPHERAAATSEGKAVPATDAAEIDDLRTRVAALEAWRADVERGR